MSSTHVLAFLDFSKEFVVKIDSCDIGIGVFLSQGHPIAYFSKGLSKTNQRLSTYEKEFMVVMMAVDKWRCYLHKNPFIIKTNHQSLTHLQDQTLSTDLQRKAMRKLVGLQFKFAYKKGSENKVADALSRIGLHFNAIIAFVPVWVQEVINSYHSDPSTTALFQELAITQNNVEEYSLVEGVIRYKDKIWVGKNSALQTKLIASFHGFALRGGIQGYKQPTTD
jgi:hypothetical protein